MIKSITNVLIFFTFQQLKSQISQIAQNGYNPFCDETLHMLMATQLGHGTKLGLTCASFQQPVNTQDPEALLIVVVERLIK